MKKVIILIIVLALLAGGAYCVKEYMDQKKEDERTEEIKKGWYVEILNKYINVRSKPDRTSGLIVKVYKDEVYKVIEMDLTDKSHYWYKIELRNGREGWIANTYDGKYLKDVNNPDDVAIPVIKFEDDEYKVKSINDIKYDHLIVWDDKDDYVITHKVYHEIDESRGINQYWIKYTITDESGKSSNKIQKIIFGENPSDEECERFADMRS